MIITPLSMFFTGEGPGYAVVGSRLKSAPCPPFRAAYLRDFCGAARTMIERTEQRFAALKPKRLIGDTPHRAVPCWAGWWRTSTWRRISRCGISHDDQAETDAPPLVGMPIGIDRQGRNYKRAAELRPGSRHARRSRGLCGMHVPGGTLSAQTVDQ